MPDPGLTSQLRSIADYWPTPNSASAWCEDIDLAHSATLPEGLCHSDKHVTHAYMQSVDVIMLFYFIFFCRYLVCFWCWSCVRVPGKVHRPVNHVSSLVRQWTTPWHWVAVILSYCRHILLFVLYCDKCWACWPWHGVIVTDIWWVCQVHWRYSTSCHAMHSTVSGSSSHWLNSLCTDTVVSLTASCVSPSTGQLSHPARCYLQPTSSLDSVCSLSPSTHSLTHIHILTFCRANETLRISCTGNDSFHKLEICSRIPKSTIQSFWHFADPKFSTL